MSASISHRAELVAQTLNGLIGALYAAQLTALMWLRYTQEHPIAAKYSLQMTCGTIFLTLRKFHDLWRSHIRPLLPKTSESRQKGEQIIDEIKTRHLRTTANRLIAHYAPERNRPPLSETEILELVKKNGWNTVQELLTWVGPVIWNLIDVREEIRRVYRVMESMDDSWMVNALDLVVSKQDTAKRARDTPRKT